MTIEEMKARKVELGYTNEMIAEMSGVPLGTVQKIFAGITKSPRYDTIQKLQNVLGSYSEHMINDGSQSEVAESVIVYNAASNGPGVDKRKKPFPVKPRKIKLGMFEGKYKMPPEELLYGDDLSDLFEDI